MSYDIIGRRIKCNIILVFDLNETQERIEEQSINNSTTTTTTNTTTTTYCDNRNSKRRSNVTLLQCDDYEYNSNDLYGT